MKNIKPIDLNIPNKLSLDENTSKEILKLKEEFKKKKKKAFMNILMKMIIKYLYQKME